MQRCTLILTHESRVHLLAAVLPTRFICVTSRSKLVTLALLRDDVVAAIVDTEHLNDDLRELGVPIIGVVDDESRPTLPTIANTLRAHPWVSQLVSLKALKAPAREPWLTMMFELMLGADNSACVTEPRVGRVARITQARRRDERLARVREFFRRHETSERVLSTIEQVAEELVTNALYDAPLDGGLLSAPVSRTQDVELDLRNGCEISYGLAGNSPFVRVRDGFGALRRERLIEVLARCNSDEVSLDESRGGAGLGLWRVFSVASAISIIVTENKQTDISVWFSTKNRATRQLCAVHLHFVSEICQHASADSDDDSVFDRSITLVA